MAVRDTNNFLNLNESHRGILQFSQWWSYTQYFVKAAFLRFNGTIKMAVPI